MVDGFVTGIRQHFIFWSGWIFTVGGAIASLWVSKEHEWIAFLLWIFVITSFGAFAYEKHADLKRATRLHEMDQTKLRAIADDLQERNTLVERKLAEVPLSLLERIEVIMAGNTLDEIVKSLSRHAAFVARIREYHRLSQTKQMEIQKITKNGNRLFVIAKAPSVEAGNVLKEGDCFLLKAKTADGLKYDIAELRVNQPPDPSRRDIYFLIVRGVHDELKLIQTFTETRDIEMKGYFVEAVEDGSDYLQADLDGFVNILRRLQESLTRLRGET